MSDRGDITTAVEETAASKTPTAETENSNATITESITPVQRYSYQVLMSLRDSPLVAKPVDMPPLSTWFGDDPEAPLSKSVLNGAITSRALANSLDKNVLLAPNKSIFSSQSYGKRSSSTTTNTEDNSNTSIRSTHTTSRYRHNDELRPNNSNGMSTDRDLRTSRSQNYSNNEWSLSNRYGNRRTNNNNNSNHKNQHRSISPSQNTRRHHQQHQHHHHYHQDNRNSSINDGSRSRRDFTREKSSTSKLTNGDAQDDRSSDKLPEWMDYNPSTEQKSVRQPETIPTAPPPGFSNDLEAWKSDMKLRDKNIEESEPSPSPQQQPPSFHGKDEPQPRKKEVSDLDLLLGGMGSMELQQPQQQQQKPQPSNMDFLSSSILESSSPSLQGSRRERGSRFAKFFAKREEEAGFPIPHEPPTEQSPQQQQPIPAQGKSISVNDLFGGNLSNASPQQPTERPHAPPQQPSVAPRMLSEEEVLQSLGAKRSPQQHQDKPTAEDALGFDKVLQILSQPKPSGPYDVRNDSIVEEQEPNEHGIVFAADSTPKQEQQRQRTPEIIQSSSPKPPVPEQRVSPMTASTLEETIVHTEPVASPVRTPAEKHHARTESTDSTQKPKLVGKAFAGNLPTSVLRQMSARSSEGRSPSIASSKSATRSFAAGSSSAGGSPALSNHSPGTVKSGLPPMVSQQQPLQHPQQANSPGHQPHPHSFVSNAYQQQQQRIPVMTSPGYPLPGQQQQLPPSTSPVVDPSVGHQTPPHPPHSMGRQQQPRNLEQMLQFAAAGDGGNGDGLSPPMMPRSGMNGNGGPMMPHHPFAGQGQGGMEQFIPPHLMQPMPPHMGPVGPGPMLPHHHHHHPLPPQLQGQVAHHQFHPMQREMMTPPTNDHPYMGNVPPPHMMGGTGLPPHMFAKSQGWDQH
ncbi:hypothetical protein BDA99DRAFT_535566 [Phascolomyces articulosus]|uniref:Uncharacterized protein n=1 Tax=Phascolomyces articulosus TaxID=60185 RepID=A0AAD5K3V6_9FUNG|nr:hypothetical protein BDA99DRAFT_535566 [Phascolomyces articulosus]